MLQFFVAIRNEIQAYLVQFTRYLEVQSTPQQIHTYMEVKAKHNKAIRINRPLKGLRVKHAFTHTHQHTHTHTNAYTKRASKYPKFEK